VARYVTSERMHKCEECALICAKREMKQFLPLSGHYYVCPRCEHIATELRSEDILSAILCQGI